MTADRRMRESIEWDFVQGAKLVAGLEIWYHWGDLLSSYQFSCQRLIQHLVEAFLGVIIVVRWFWRVTSGGVSD